MTELEACLPPDLRGATITKIATGLSGAGVYRVEASDQTYVLKVSDLAVPIADWQRVAELQQLAAAAGIAPRVIHVDAERRAIVSAFVQDHGFARLLMTPQTRRIGIEKLAAMLQTLASLPVPAEAPAKDPRAFFAKVWSWLDGLALPAFVHAAAAWVMTTEPPPYTGAPRICHGDANPSNLAFDGERVLLLDWDTAAAYEPFYDTATIALFMRLDDATTKQLLGTESLPPRFLYDRAFVSALCGCLFFHLARKAGHAGGEATLEATRSLAEIYPLMREGTFDPASRDGQWSFGLALVKEGATLRA